jgi:hypothetical protein
MPRSVSRPSGQRDVTATAPVDKYNINGSQHVRFSFTRGHHGPTSNFLSTSHHHTGIRETIARTRWANRGACAIGSEGRLVGEVMPPFLGYPAQPDYMEMVDAYDPPFLPTLIRDMWIEGDYLERRAVDRLLERQRRSMERDMKSMFTFD